jgi:hypothetical protein
VTTITVEIAETARFIWKLRVSLASSAVVGVVGVKLRASVFTKGIIG